MLSSASMRMAGTLFAWLVLLLLGCGASKKPPSVRGQSTHVTVSAESAADATEGPLIAIDTHVDTTQRMLDEGDDIGTELEGGHLDIPRMNEGGLTGAFFSLWVNPSRHSGDAAFERAKALAMAVRAVAQRHPDRARLCTTGEEVREAAAEGRVALLMGIEGAHALGTDDVELAAVRLGELFELGARYMTITWSSDNAFGHSSTGQHADRGLTPSGRWLVQEMNRLGMIVDISHVSDQTFWDVMEVARWPVMASHSSVRALSDHPRNMTDAMISKVARGGGAVCVNYFSNYIDVAYRDRRRRLEAAHAEAFQALATEHERYVDRGRSQLRLAMELDENLRPPTVATLGEHFEHIARVGGSTAACLGSDFDGVQELPLGMEDVSDLGALREELARRRLDVHAILGANVLRILDSQGDGGARP